MTKTTIDPKKVSMWYDAFDGLVHFEPLAPAPHIITTNGRHYDLTALETPLGLLPKPVRGALQKWPHGVEVYTGGEWKSLERPPWLGNAVYRARPAPVETTHVLDFGTPDSLHTLTIRYPGKSLPHGEYTGPDGARITVEAE